MMRVVQKYRQDTPFMILMNMIDKNSECIDALIKLIVKFKFNITRFNYLKMTKKLSKKLGKLFNIDNDFWYNTFETYNKNLNKIVFFDSKEE